MSTKHKVRLLIDIGEAENIINSTPFEMSIVPKQHETITLPYSVTNKIGDKIVNLRPASKERYMSFLSRHSNDFIVSKLTRYYDDNGDCITTLYLYAGE